MEVNAATLSEKLQKLTNTQVAIEGVSTYLLLYRKHARQIVQVWDSEYYKASSDKKLTFLYLANHVLQEGRKKGREYMDEFAKVLPKALRTLHKTNEEKLKKSVVRLISLWSERNVFNAVNIKQMQDAVGSRSNSGGGRLSGAVAAAGPSLTGEDRKRLQVVGNLPDALLAAQDANDKTSEWAQKSLNVLKQGAIEAFSAAQVLEAAQVMASYGAAIETEVVARRRALQLLEKIIEHQRDELTRAEDAGKLCRLQQDKLGDRSRSLQAAGAAAYTAAQAPVAAPPAAAQQQQQAFRAPTAPPPAAAQQQQPAAGYGSAFAPSASAAPPYEPQHMQLPMGPPPDLSNGQGAAAGGLPGPQASADLDLQSLLADEEGVNALMAALQSLPEEERNKIGFDLPADLLGGAAAAAAPLHGAAAGAAGNGEADMDLGDEEYDPEYPA